MFEEIARSLAEAAKFVLFYVLWTLVLFNIGRITLLLGTLGRYPRGSALHQHVDRISLVGLAVIVVIWTSVALHNHFAPAV